MFAREVCARLLRSISAASTPRTGWKCQAREREFRKADDDVDSSAMNRSEADSNGRPQYVPIVVGSRGRIPLAPVLRLLPTLATLALCGALAGACGRSPYAIADSSPTPTATITTSPSVGNFLYSSNFFDGKVCVFTRNVSTGALARVGPTGAGSINGPMGIANGPSAKFLYVANSADNNVRQYKINQTSGKLAKIGSGTIAAGSSPQWIAVTPNAQFAFAINSGDATITPYTVDATTGALTANGTAFSSLQLTKPVAAVASNTFLYVTDSINGTIVSFPIGAPGTLSAGTSTALSLVTPPVPAPGPLIMDPTGKFVYVTDQNFGVVYFLTVGAGVLTLTGTYSPSAKGEGGLAIGTTSAASEFLFVANQLLPAPSISVFKINGNGSLSIPTLYPDASLKLPTGVAVDPTGGFLYVANQANGTITQFTINAISGALTNPAIFHTESMTSKPLYLALGQ
jgi:6-phosphogluconolactonase